MNKVEKREIVLRHLAQPTDVNFGGKVHGGMVMKWIDQAGYACAVSWSSAYAVTVYVGGIRFISPILIGNLVEVRAKLIYTGRTSMHIAVDVLASDPREGTIRKATHCIIVFVAVGEDGKPVAVPAWEPETEEDQSLSRYAQRLMELRSVIEEEMNRYF